jgi:hypothetical protein
MTYELTVQEKTDLINTHLKNLEYNKYNLELSLIEENSLEAPSSTVISSINEQIENLSAKKSALLTELDELTA